jgi:chemotaxis protein methyltransferase CheR
MPGSAIMPENHVLPLSDDDMHLFQCFFRTAIGVHLPMSRKALLAHRLSVRVHALGMHSLKEYYALLLAPDSIEERQIVVALMTINTTSFFREEHHFSYLRDNILPGYKKDEEILVWSAASATGEEAYSLAMLFDDVVGGEHWHVLGSDISRRVLVFAQRALYPIRKYHKIHRQYQHRYCLQGTGEYEGHFLIHQDIRRRVHFAQINLLDVHVDVQQRFDIIFLRNVTMYFDPVTRIKVIRAVLDKLKPGGYLMLGPTESLDNRHEGVAVCAPSIYRRV